MLMASLKPSKKYALESNLIGIIGWRQNSFCRVTDANAYSYARVVGKIDMKLCNNSTYLSHSYS